MSAPIDPAVLRKLDAKQAAFLMWQARWAATARPNQIPPDDFTECGFMAGRGFGKALALDTPIPTPTGWAAMGDLRDGDTVFDERGQPCRVVKAHDPYTPATLHRVVFDDGSVILADGEHLWATLSRADRRAKRGPRVCTTAEIAATLRCSNESNHAIPTTLPLSLPEADLPIDPYLLGLWLGDGHSAGGSITTADREVVEAFERAGYHMRRWAADNSGAARTYGITTGANRQARSDDTGQFTAGGFPLMLRQLDLINNKHVPPVYLRASAEQRLALVQGLMDSDGHVNPANGNMEFCTIKQHMAHEMLELALSLGWKARLYEDRARLNGEDKGPRFRVCWQADANQPPVRLRRKVAALRHSRAPASQRRYIKSADRVPAQTVRCITVDSPSRLYLAGRSMIATHNTRVGAEWLARRAYLDAEGMPRSVIAPTYPDVKFTCFEGESGLLSVIPPELLKHYNKSDMVIEMWNCAGGVSSIRGFTAEKPDRLRGPQSADIWGDELAAWQYDETWDMAMFGLRLGADPRIVWTTTPKPRALVRKLTVPKPKRVIVTGATYDNKANLPDSFFDQLAQYEGTTLGRQELHGELIDPEEAGIIRRSWLQLWPAKKPLPRFDWIIMSLDTAFTEKSLDKRGDPDPSACGVFGVFHHDGKAQIMLLDCWDEHLGLPDLIRKVKRELQVSYGDDADQALIRPLFGSDKPRTSGRKPDICLIEDKGSGISLRQSLAAEGIEAYAYNPGRADKLSRLHIVSPVFAQKRVWLPESEKNAGQPRTWCEPLLAQLCSFTGPGSVKHDDYVDVVSQSLRLCLDKGLISLIKPKPQSDAPPPRKAAPNPYAQ